MLMLFRSFVRYQTYVFAASLTWLFAGDDTWMKRLRDSRKTECGAKQFLTHMVVRAAPFALLRSLALAFRSDV
jgi:hypothetical protein